MKETDRKINRIIGLDMHPDVFAAAALQHDRADRAKTLWVQDRLPTADLEKWARKHLRAGDTLVLEASGNSFEVANRFHTLGYTCLVLESAQSAKIRNNFCNDDRHSAIKLARVYLSGLAKLVWQPTEECRQMREVFFCHRATVKDCTRIRNRIRTYLNEYCVRLPRGTRLTQEKGLNCALASHPWSPLQTGILTNLFQQLWQAEERRKSMEQIMVEQLVQRPEWSQLWRLMGVRHIVAFGLMALIGDIKRFPSHKKLVGYIGLSPRKEQSGNNTKGRELGTGEYGRGDLRALLIQSAQNAMNQPSSPLHKWGIRLTFKKSRNLAVAAVARKLVVAIWHLLQGHFTPITEINNHIKVKMLKIATLLGSSRIKDLGFHSRDDFILHHFQQIQNTQLSSSA